MTKPEWDYLKAGAMIAALVTMAPAEYHLAQGCGFGQYLAAGLPASLDIYTLRAIRTGRDVLAVGVVMIAVNAASHLIAAGHLAVSWGLIVAVSALPILVLIRVERLGKGAQDGGHPEAEPMDDHFRAAAELTEPEPEPVVVERTDKPELPAWPRLGPMTPVAELLAATPAAPAVAPAVAPVALLSVADVAETKGVAEGTVRSWVKRDKLAPAERDSNGRLLFHPDAVAALGATP